MRWILLKGGHVFDPEDRGAADVLMLGGEIAVVGPGLAAPTGVGEGEIVDVSGCILLPGLIDPHIHVMGASGMGGTHDAEHGLADRADRGRGRDDRRLPARGRQPEPGHSGSPGARRRPGVRGDQRLLLHGGLEESGADAHGGPAGGCGLRGSRARASRWPIAEPMAPAYTPEELCRLAHAAWTGGRLAGKRLRPPHARRRSAGRPRPDPRGPASDGHPGRTD